MNISAPPPSYFCTQDQDHYAVLGLARLRHNASFDAVRKACEQSLSHVRCFNRNCDHEDRRTVIKYHPDKQDVSNEPLPPDSDQDAVFTCIKIGGSELLEGLNYID